MAIADLIDNSLYAKAKCIRVDYDWNSGNPWFRILDDGIGMSESRLREAMRLGTQSPTEIRHEEDLGRFGLGLKTASFSQCRLLTVQTKVDVSHVSTRSWDLDHVCQTGKWEIGLDAPRGAKPLLSVLDKQESGTIVLCQKLDRLVATPSEDGKALEQAYLNSFGLVARYLEMVFHRYLTGRDKVLMWVGRHQCRPWDPFLSGNEFTQHLSPEYLDSRRIEVKPYVLPHVSKRTAEETHVGAGIYGWNAHQGFYVYRNRRMIIAGGYLDLPFTAEEHYKLCRLKVDLPNDIDHEWSLDVRKAAATPPAKLRANLERIARYARAQAAEVYRARSGSGRRSATVLPKHDVWLKHRAGDKISYQINTENIAVSKLLNEIKAPKRWAKQLFHLIEKTVPHRLIVMDNAELEDCQVDLPADFAPPPKELIELCCSIFRDRVKLANCDPHSAADYACSFFDDHPAYRAKIDNLIEGQE